MTYSRTHQIQGPRPVLGLVAGVSWNGASQCQLLLDRAADLLPADPRIRGPVVTAPIRQQSAPVRDG
jgi:hypothetical protein